MKTYEVAGMSCQHCVDHVRQAIDKVPGVERVAVDLKSRTAIVEGDHDPRLVQAEVRDAGYDATPTVVRD